MVLRLALPLAALLLLPTSRVRAESVTVLSSANCPAATLVEELAKRLPERNLTHGAEGPIRIALSERPGEVQATLELALEDGSTLRRSIDAPTCEEARHAILFVASLALDPDAPEPVVLRAAAEDSPSSSAEPAPPETALESTGEQPPAALLRRWRAGLGLSARAMFGPAPSALLGGEVLASLTPEHAGFWSPSGRVAFSLQSSGPLEQELGTASFSNWVATVDLCPSRGVLGLVSLRVCAASSAGVLFAEGSETFEPRSARRPWLSLGLSALLELQLSRVLFLGFRGSVDSPIIRDEFAFDEEAFHAVPLATGTAAGGLEIRFR